MPAMQYAAVFPQPLYSSVGEQIPAGRMCTSSKSPTIQVPLLPSLSLYCTAQHCILLYSSALYCIILYSTPLYTVLHCITLHSKAQQYCTTLHSQKTIHSTALHYSTAWHCIAQHSTVLALHCTAQYCTTISFKQECSAFKHYYIISSMCLKFFIIKM